MKALMKPVSAAVLLIVSFCGCSSQPAEVAPQATAELTALRDQIFTAKAQIQSASNAASDLLKQPRQDLTPQVERLKTTVAALNSTRAQVREQGQAFRESSNAYFQKWDDLLRNMSPDTAAKGKERMEEARHSIERLRQDADAVRADVRPFMADINEATTYLATDTTRSGLQIVAPKLSSAVGREPAILKNMDRLVADIDAIRSHR